MRDHWGFQATGEGYKPYGDDATKFSLTAKRKILAQAKGFLTETEGLEIEVRKSHEKELSFVLGIFPDLKEFADRHYLFAIYLAERVVDIKDYVKGCCGRGCGPGCPYLIGLNLKVPNPIQKLRIRVFHTTLLLQSYFRCSARRPWGHHFLQQCYERQLKGLQSP